MELNRKKIDKEIVAQRFKAAIDTYDNNAVAQKHIQHELLRIITAYCPEIKFKSALDIGCGTCGMTKLLDNEFGIKYWTLNDLNEECYDHGSFRTNTRSKVRFIAGDAEEINYGGTYDLIVCSSTMQWFHDLNAFFLKIKNHLKKDGYILLSTFGPDNLKEIKKLTGHGLHYPKGDDLKAMLEKHFELCYFQQEHYNMEFTSPREVLEHLKHTGVNAVSATNNFWTPCKLRCFEKDYRYLFGNAEGKVSLTYNPIYILARL